MPEQPDNATAGGRTIAVRLQLEGGHSIDLRLREDAPELAALFRILASRGNENVEPIEMFLQLPVQGGKASCSFHSRQLVSVITEPPVLVQLEMPAAARSAPSHRPAAVGGSASTRRSPPLVSTPRVMLIDDFLSADEYQALLDYAQGHEAEFESGTVEGKASPHRQNRVIMGFADTTHARLLQNRLLTWFPLLVRGLDLELFPVRQVESQLTATNDGHYYRVHCDAGPEHADFRRLTCVYYFFRQPRPFSGGNLRLYDTVLDGDQRRLPGSYREFAPTSNRLLAFPSTAFHELMQTHCPSRQFADSRFAVTNWLHSGRSDDPEARFGWGHLRCGVVPAGSGARAGVYR